MVVLQADISTRRRKVKTGCRTCKIRKVKCDEGRPACQCCLSTGRVCDGYGIWGGGGNQYGQRTTKTTAICYPKPPTTTFNTRIKLPIEKVFAPNPVSTAGPEEQGYFEYFTRRTLTKLSGIFGSCAWDAIVFQACANEPAVMHAALALSSAHKRKECSGVGRDRSLVFPDQQEQFMLRHYNKAIGHLQPQSLPGGKHSVRTALIACLLFYYIEILRGDYAASCTHLESGLKLAVHISRPALRVSKKKASPQPETVDDSLAQTFMRLQVLCALAAHYSQGHDRPPQAICNALPTSKFQSVEEARFYIDLVLESVGHITNEYHRTPDPDAWPASYREALTRDRCFTQAALDTWLRTYDATLIDAPSRGGAYEEFNFQLLRPYHTMATIMAATCLSLDNQMVFDHYILAFTSIIAQSVEITETAKRLNIRNTLTGKTSPKEPMVISDSGWVSPMYYTALKCRDYDVRTQAASLLGSEWHTYSDDFFHSAVAAAVAVEIVNIEDKGLEAECDEGAIGCEPHLESELQEAAPLPEERRIQRVDVVLPADESSSIRLVCKRKVRGEWRVLARTYNASNGVWLDVPT